MLEHRILVVRSRTHSSVQEIVDGESGAVLGYVRRETEPSPWWRHLFRRAMLAVHEQEDEPLLLTISPSWGWPRTHCVCDADGSFVGSLKGRFILDRYGRLLAALENGVFRAPDQRVLADLDSTTHGQRLTFREEISGEPFVKMLLLAATLQIAA